MNGDDGGALEAHHRAPLGRLDELDAKHGAPTPEELTECDALLDELERDEDGVANEG